MSADLWEREQTVIRPNPGGRSAPAGATVVPEQTALLTALNSGAVDDVVRSVSDGGAGAGAGVPLLVAAARPVLNLLDRLRTIPHVDDVMRLRSAVIEEMRAYERRVAHGSVDLEQARIAHYALCATIDDVVLATDWGRASDWGANSIVSTFHRDVQGGERMFELLEHQHRDPGRNRDVLMLFYLCLSLGFRGRLRVSPRGGLELSQIRDGLYRTLRGLMGDIEREIAPHWRGVDARHSRKGLRYLLPAFLALLLLAAALGYVGLLDLINTRSDATIVAAALLPPEGDASIAIAGQPVPPEPERISRFDRFLVFLQPEIERGLLTTTRRDDEVLVRYRGTGTFAPGSADVSPGFAELLARVGRGIQEAGFEVLVVGHTDDRPIRSVRFPSNWHLSQARAEAVAAITRAHVDPDRVRFEGRGETEPVDTNETAQGRAANRRIEMLVTIPAGSDPTIVIDGDGAARNQAARDAVENLRDAIQGASGGGNEGANE